MVATEFTNISGPARATTAQFLAVLVMFLTTSFAKFASADEAAPHPSSVRFETHFMREMINHHHMAVMMSETCLTKAVHEPLLTMCASIQDTQQQEINMLQSWLGKWYGILHEPQMRRSEMRDLEAMTELPAEEYEMAFMKSMIPHHLQAIESSSSCLIRASHGELIGTCAKIIAAQAKEIETLRTWLCEWYEICHFHKGHRQMH